LNASIAHGVTPSGELKTMLPDAGGQRTFTLLLAVKSNVEKLGRAKLCWIRR